MSRFLRDPPRHHGGDAPAGRARRRPSWRAGSAGPRPGSSAGLWAVAGVALFVGRARAGMPDRRGRHPAIVRLVDIPYFIHWCACALDAHPVGRRHAGRRPWSIVVRGMPVRCRSACTWSRTSRGSSSAATASSCAGAGFRVVEREVPRPGARPAARRVAHRAALGPAHRDADAPLVGPALGAVGQRCTRPTSPSSPATW